MGASSQERMNLAHAAWLYRVSHARSLFILGAAVARMAVMADEPPFPFVILSGRPGSE